MTFLNRNKHFKSKTAGRNIWLSSRSKDNGHLATFHICRQTHLEPQISFNKV